MITHFEFASGQIHSDMLEKVNLLVCYLTFCSSGPQKETLLLTRLHVGDQSRVVKRAGEKVSPAGGPTGVAHSSRVAGVNPEASPTLCRIPHLPDAGTSHQAKATNLPRLQQQSLLSLTEDSLGIKIQKKRDCMEFLAFKQMVFSFMGLLSIVTSVTYKRRTKSDPCIFYMA